MERVVAGCWRKVRVQDEVHDIPRNDRHQRLEKINHHGRFRHHCTSARAPERIDRCPLLLTFSRAFYFPRSLRVEFPVDCACLNSPLR